MTTQSEQSLENNLIQQLVGLGYEHKVQTFHTIGTKVCDTSDDQSCMVL